MATVTLKEKIRAKKAELRVADKALVAAERAVAKAKKVAFKIASDLSKLEAKLNA